MSGGESEATGWVLLAISSAAVAISFATPDVRYCTSGGIQLQRDWVEKSILQSPTGQDSQVYLHDKTQFRLTPCSNDLL